MQYGVSCLAAFRGQQSTIKTITRDLKKTLQPEKELLPKEKSIKHLVPNKRHLLLGKE